LKRNLRRG